jgi:hypothetical protein
MLQKWGSQVRIRLTFWFTTSASLSSVASVHRFLDVSRNRPLAGAPHSLPHLAFVHRVHVGAGGAAEVPGKFRHVGEWTLDPEHVWRVDSSQYPENQRTNFFPFLLFSREIPSMYVGSYSGWQTGWPDLENFDFWTSVLFVQFFNLRK